MWRKMTQRTCSPISLPSSTVSRPVSMDSAGQNAKRSALSRNCKERTSMKLVEQHVITGSDPRYPRLDEAAFASKNLWNAANYLVRQSFIFPGVYLNNTAVFHLIK